MMRWFNYEGTDAQGRPVHGALLARNHAEAEPAIRQRGVSPGRIYELDRIKVLEDSLGCYAMGWLSLLPVLGVIAAVRAFALYQRARVDAGKEWNPASRYLLGGFVLAWIGSLVSLLATGGIMLLVLKIIMDE